MNTDLSCFEVDLQETYQKLVEALLAFGEAMQKAGEAMATFWHEFYDGLSDEEKLKLQRAIKKDIGRERYLRRMERGRKKV